MSLDVTMQSFALDMQISVERLIEQFLYVGIKKTKFDLVTQKEKEVLYEYMHHHNNTLSMHKFELRRQTRSMLNILSAGGKNKKIQIEVRKKQTYVVPCFKQKYQSNNLCTEENSSKNINKSNNDYKPINLTTNDKLIISKTSKIENNILFDQTSKKDMCSMDIVHRDKELEKKSHFKMSNKVQKIINKKQQLNKVKDIHVNLSSRSATNYFDNNRSDKPNHSIRSDVDMKNNDIYKLIPDKRYTTKIRSKYKSINKLFKQKKSNINYLYEVISNEDDKEEKLYTSSRVNKNKRKHSALIQSFSKPTQIIPRNIIIGDTISILELSNKMSVKSSYMIKLMMKLGFVVTINQILDQETAQLIIEEMGHIAVVRRENALEELVMNDNRNYCNSFSVKNKNNDDPMIYKNRAPVVTIMGHVDHGKTSILDYIRSTKIVDYEAGGITQSIKAYRFTTKNGGLITFIDTPGHAAFTNMRERGVKLTDIAVLVVAADDGVMPQTVESIKHIRSTNIPVIIAINKIDKMDVNIDKIKRELNHYGFIPEEWGGNTQFVNVSAVSGAGINDLLDAIILQSEILELKTAYHGMAKAIVIESSVDKGRGPIVMVLIKEGKLKCGDIILCGTEYGRVRAIRDEYGCDINTAWPSMPVEILGLSGVPNTGDIMVVVNNEKKAKEVAIYRKDKSRIVKLSRNKQEEYTIERVFNNMNNNIKLIELNFIVKSDTKGSMEAICEALNKFSTSEKIIKVLLASIGNITETDAILALTSNAIILGFNVKSDVTARRIIEINNLEVRYYSIIYDLLNDVNNIIHSNISTSSVTSVVIGSAVVHNIFKSPTYGTIAGCIVQEGIIKSRKKIIVFRNNSIIHKGELESLRRFKNDVNEVKNGMECGIVIKNYHDIKFGDIIKVLDTIGLSN